MSSEDLHFRQPQIAETSHLRRTTEKGDLPKLRPVGHLRRTFPGDRHRHSCRRSPEQPQLRQPVLQGAEHITGDVALDLGEQLLEVPRCLPYVINDAIADVVGLGTGLFGGHRPFFAPTPLADKPSM